MTVRYLRDDQRHLICEPYSIDGLHAMAADLGIHRRWYHRGRKYAHYDIPKGMASAVAARSELVSPRVILATIQAASAEVLL